MSVPKPVESILRHELKKARAKANSNDGAAHYWLGVIDGLVVAMQAMGVSTKP